MLTELFTFNLSGNKNKFNDLKYEMLHLREIFKALHIIQ